VESSIEGVMACARSEATVASTSSPAVRVTSKFTARPGQRSHVDTCIESQLVQARVEGRLVSSLALLMHHAAVIGRREPQAVESEVGPMCLSTRESIRLDAFGDILPAQVVVLTVSSSRLISRTAAQDNSEDFGEGHRGAGWGRRELGRIGGE
jgi:hypothetical protein